MLKTRKETLEGKVCLVSGSGNVSQYTVEKLLELGAKPVTMSRLQRRDLRSRRHQPREAGMGHGAEERSPRPHPRVRGEVQEGDLYAHRRAAWITIRFGTIKADCAFPSATQNEINAKDAANLIKNGVEGLWPRAPTCPARWKPPSLFIEAKILYGPAKAANAGGVAVSGSGDGAEQRPHELDPQRGRRETAQIMIAIHKNCFETAETYGTPGNLVNGANIGGFLKVANAMMDQGLV